MLALPREIVAKIVPKPADARALHRTCREMCDRTRGIFCREASTKNSWKVVKLFNEISEIYVDYDHTESGGTMWTGDDYDSEPEDLVPDVHIWELWIPASRIIFMVTMDGAPMRALIDDLEKVRQYIGVYLSRIYVVAGFYNNFAGIPLADVVVTGGKFIFAGMRPHWGIYHTDTPLHTIAGTVLVLKLIETDL